MYTDSFVPTFLNREPAVVLGLTETELILSFSLSIFFSLMLSIPFAFFSFMIALVIFLSFLTVFLFIFSAGFKRFKIGKPRGYFQALMKVKLGMGGDSFYIKDVQLKVGRTVKRVVEYE